jgi:hypothetical protein
MAAGLSVLSHSSRSFRHCFSSNARADVAIRDLILGCSRVSSHSTGFGGGFIAPSGAMYATGCM